MQDKARTGVWKLRGLVKKRVMELGDILHMVAQGRLRGKSYLVFGPAGIVIPILDKYKERR